MSIKPYLIVVDVDSEPAVNKLTTVISRLSSL